ncbi:hypothetical protein LO762_18730 [Actinocorallia sp. API 0066]|uniref:DUF4350 domain-containing protein n=1 Tax=Actinocorallia sp. API 0066 TaxID=2896846 RepID=UPI001E637C19|nr:DUF4350 domain-containing protein [Actinocorallia sp. API 0066]MCD0451217.1 hypothetical protein [Actinocorallia sp. API 0066]
MTATATDAPAPESAGQVAGRRFRRWRGIVAALFAVVLLAVVLAALRPPVTSGYLDPEDAGRDGSRALAEIVRQQGTPVEVVRSANAAASAARSTKLVVVVRSERLTEADLTVLANATGSVLLIAPTDAALARLAPGVERTGTAPDTGPAEDGCALGAAAGAVDFGESHVYRAAETGTACYLYEDYDPASSFFRLVRSEGAKTVTVAGSGRPFTNRHLTEEGAAALGLTLLSAQGGVVWLIPDLPSEDEITGDQSFMDLVPTSVWLFFLQGLVAVALAALWRARRLGPVVVERLPVAVRSAEAVEGRARLYRAAHARDRAALALREAARERLVPLLGLPRSAAADPARAAEVVPLAAARSGLDAPTAYWALYGPEPGDDGELLRLTDLLDELERRVR